MSERGREGERRERTSIQSSQARNQSSNYLVLARVSRLTPSKVASRRLYPMVTSEPAKVTSHAQTTYSIISKVTCDMAWHRRKRKTMRFDENAATALRICGNCTRDRRPKHTWHPAMPHVDAVITAVIVWHGLTMCVRNVMLHKKT